MSDAVPAGHLLRELANGHQIHHQAEGRRHATEYGDQYPVPRDASDEPHHSSPRVFYRSHVGSEVFRHAYAIEKLLAHPFSPFLALVECVCPILDICEENRSRNRGQLNSTGNSLKSQSVESDGQLFCLPCDIRAVA